MRVLVVDDDPPASAGLAGALAAAGAEVIAPVARGRAGLALGRRHAPDIVFVAGSTAPVDGVPVLDALTAMGLGIRTILVASAPTADEAVAAIRGGARGYVSPSDLAGDRLPAVLATVAADALVCPRWMLAAVVGRLAAAPAPAPRPSREPAGDPLRRRE